MKYHIKGSPLLTYVNKQVRGFQYVNQPIFGLSVLSGCECSCYLEINVNKDLMTYDDVLIIQNQINELDIHDPKNHDLVHFISEIYGFHGFDLEKFANEEGVVVGINMAEIEDYVNSLVELELEIELEEYDFTYKITNIKEGNYDLKDTLSDLMIM
ncbi:hypothetical protein [Methanobrevibacter sp.]|uniref:hypothetical protein n=1 Tax=Methanobrevibacter sp. TaxID=66852 RepID=UPI00386A2A33